MNQTLYSPLLARPIPESPRTPPRSSTSSWSSFPASRGRSGASVVSLGPPAPDKVLIKTGGNALQAVDRETLDNDSNLLAVSVPIGVNPGDRIVVSVPDGTSRLIEAVVPPGMFPGHTFLVRIPDLHGPQIASVLPYDYGDIRQAALIESRTHVVAGHDMEGLRLAEVLPSEVEAAPVPTTTNYNNNIITSQYENHQFEMASQQRDGGVGADLGAGANPTEAMRNVTTATAHVENVAAPTPTNGDEDDGNLVLVRVPPGSTPGSSIRVRLEDGRLIEGVVPEGNVSEFFMRIPPPESQPHQQQQAPSSQQQQNWHNHPLAIAPMALGPFMT